MRLALPKRSLRRQSSQSAAVPKPLRPWLYQSGSLTKHIKQLTQGEFRVELISQGYSKLSPLDARRYHLPCNRYVWQRQVFLYGKHAQPIVQASTIITTHQLYGKMRGVKQLRNRSLGSLLFARGAIPCQRSIYQLQGHWGRTSRYTWGNSTIWVSETFLPDFFTALQSR